ncbi:MAG: hypothetical protein ACTS27_06355 [Phycisphaerales bacterium]
MTTAQRMLASLRRVAAPLFAVACFAATGCVSTVPREELVPPRVLVAPYHEGRGGQAETLWAVAPLRNESGTTFVDALAMTDALTQQLEEVRGITTLPLNRTAGMMQALGLNSIDSPQQARSLIEALGVDGLVVGSITAYDPYDPPEYGLAVALFARPGAMGTQGARPDDPLSSDPSLLNAATTDSAIDVSTESLAPVSFAAEHLDARNHEVQMAVKSYADGRADTVSALGWRRYLVSMPLYADFARFRLAERLLESERLRLARTLVSDAGTTDR